MTVYELFRYQVRPDNRLQLHIDRGVYIRDNGKVSFSGWGEVDSRRIEHIDRGVYTRDNGKPHVLGEENSVADTSNTSIEGCIRETMENSHKTGVKRCSNTTSMEDRKGTAGDE